MKKRGFILPMKIIMYWSIFNGLIKNRTTSLPPRDHSSDKRLRI
jgi:hypothetical protein